MHLAEVLIDVPSHKATHLATALTLCDLPQANRADAANDTFARILSVVQTDGEAKYYEEAHVHWISALSTTGIRDLGLCSAQVETLTRRHRENPCAPLTQKRVLAICSTIIREFDSSGSFKKSIEWRQRVMPWTTEADSSAMAKQIVRIAVRIGAMDVAEQYMLKCGPEDRDTLVLKMQVMFKAAKPGSFPSPPLSAHQIYPISV